MTSSKMPVFICGLFNDAVIIQTVSSIGMSTLIEIYGLRVFKNRKLRKIFVR
jgi:hypothetical protein